MLPPPHSIIIHADQMFKLFSPPLILQEPAVPPSVMLPCYTALKPSPQIHVQYPHPINVFSFKPELNRVFSCLIIKVFFNLFSHLPYVIRIYPLFKFFQRTGKLVNNEYSEFATLPHCPVFFVFLPKIQYRCHQ